MEAGKMNNIFGKAINISCLLLLITFLSVNVHANTEKLFEDRIEWIIDRNWRSRKVNLKVFPVTNQRSSNLINNFEIIASEINLPRKKQLDYLNDIGFLKVKEVSSDVVKYSLTIKGLANLSGSSGLYLGNYEFDKIKKLEKINLAVGKEIVVFLVEANLKVNLLDWAKGENIKKIFPVISNKTKDISEYYILFKGSKSFDHSMKIRKEILAQIKGKRYDRKRISGVFNLETILPNKEEKDLFEKSISIKRPEDKEIIDSLKKACSVFSNTESINMLLYRRIDFTGYPGTELRFKFMAESKNHPGVKSLCYGELSYNRVHKTLCAGTYSCDDLTGQ